MGLAVNVGRATVATAEDNTRGGGARSIVAADGGISHHDVGVAHYGGGRASAVDIAKDAYTSLASKAADDGARVGGDLGRSTEAATKDILDLDPG